MSAVSRSMNPPTSREQSHLRVSHACNQHDPEVAPILTVVILEKFLR